MENINVLKRKESKSNQAFQTCEDFDPFVSKSKTCSDSEGMQTYLYTGLPKEQIQQIQDLPVVQIQCYFM